MSNTASRATLSDIHEKLATRLVKYLEKLESDPDLLPDPRMIAVIIKFLKDNSIEALAGVGDNPMEKLRAIAGGKAPVLPFSAHAAANEAE